MVDLYFGKNRNELLKYIFGADFDKICVADSGKPYIPNGPKFNLSHSGDITVCAVGTVEIGIDIELIKPRNIKRIIRIFSAAEKNRISTLDGNEKLQEFYRCWTAKEAKAKQLGSGIDRNLIKNTDYMSENFFISGMYDEKYIFTLFSEKKVNIKNVFFGKGKVRFYDL